MILLDSSALLAALQRESGGKQVETTLGLGKTAITTANLSEVLSVLATRAGVPVSETLHTLHQLPLKIVTVSQEIAVQSAELLARWPKSGLSLGDCICLATGLLKHWHILTADTAWLKYKMGVEIQLIR